MLVYHAHLGPALVELHLIEHQAGSRECGTRKPCLSLAVLRPCSAAPMHAASLTALLCACSPGAGAASSPFAAHTRQPFPDHASCRSNLSDYGYTTASDDDDSDFEVEANQQQCYAGAESSIPPPPEEGMGFWAEVGAYGAAAAGTAFHSRIRRDGQHFLRMHACISAKCSYPFLHVRVNLRSMTVTGDGQPASGMWTVKFVWC